MKKIFLSLLSISAFASITNTANITSDYVWRGQGQGDGAALQGSMNYSPIKNLTAGLWLSNIADGNVEVDMSLFYSIPMGANKLSIGSTFYHYPHSGTADTVEYTLSLESVVGALSVNYISDYFGTDTSSMYFSWGRSFELSAKEKLSLGLSLGYTDFDEEDKASQTSYLDYKVSLKKAYDSIDVSVFYSDTDRETITNGEYTEVDDKSVGLNIDFKI